MKGLLYHTLKGSNGWSTLAISTIDVAKVLKMTCHKRLFMICDRDLPYTLTIRYDEPKETIGFAPTTRPGVITVYNETQLEQTITKRYKTEQELLDEVTEIKKKQQQITNWITNIRCQIIQTDDKDKTF